MFRGRSLPGFEERVLALLGPCISAAMRELVEGLADVAGAREVSIFLGGPRGVGKTTLARLIHEISGLPGAFIRTNLSLSTMLEASLVGFRRGAFTDAKEDRDGYLLAANDGSLFLDEIGCLPADVQGKLLTYFDCGEHMPIGALEPVQSEFRIISATNQDPADLASKGILREDFLDRISHYPVRIPPLAERPEDILPLAESILRKIRPRTSIEVGAARVLERHSWPGNIRQLETCLRITACRLPQRKESIEASDLFLRTWADLTPLSPEEQAMIDLAKQCKFNQQRMAEESSRRENRELTRSAINAYLSDHPRLRLRFDELKTAHEAEHGQIRRPRRIATSKNSPVSERQLDVRQRQVDEIKPAPNKAE